MYSFMGVNINVNSLVSKDELLKHLEENGETYHALIDIRNRYESELGIDPVWRYPICDGDHAGFVMVPVREGFLTLPFDEIDAEEYEVFVLQDAMLLDEESLSVYLQDFRSYADGLIDALGEARLFYRNAELQRQFPINVMLTAPFDGRNLVDLYKLVFELAGFTDTDEIVYDCTKIDVADNIRVAVYEALQRHQGATDVQCAMKWAASGPKSYREFEDNTVVLHPGFACIIDPSKAKKQ